MSDAEHERATPGDIAAALGESAMRVELAMAELDVTGTAATLLASWVRGLPYAAHIDSDESLEIGVAVSADRGRTTWRASGRSMSMIPAMLDFFDLVGADAGGQSAISRFGEVAEPSRLGHWLLSRGDYLDAGWYVPEPVALAHGQSVAQPSEGLDVLLGWCDDHDLTHFESVERSLGPADFTGFRLALPGSDPHAQIVSAADLMDDLDLGPLEPAVAGLLTADDDAELEASIWLIPDGVARFAVGSVQPDPSVLVGLLMLAGADADADAVLARVQGAMNADRPAYVEAARFMDSFDVEVGWTLDT